MGRFILLCEIRPISNFKKNDRSEERAALVQFKNHFSIVEGSEIPKTSSWKEDDEDCCMWQGVSCDNVTGHVIGLYLRASRLNGTIPLNSSLFSLVHLQELDLEDNLFAISRISPSFSNLSKLTFLSLCNSEFSGIVPNEIYELPELQTLYLCSNIGLVSKLGSQNATQKSKLLDINLSYTNFTRESLDTIHQFKSLECLSLSGCNFSGLIPPSLGNLTKLVCIIFNNNNFSGEVPSIISRLPNLTFLDLSYNNLYGHISPSLGNLSNLSRFFVQNNDLSGPLPSQLLNLSSLGMIDVTNNQFTGTIDLNIFANHPFLETLRLSNSGLSVSNTNSNIFSTLPKITSLYLSSCNVSISNLTYSDSPMLENLDLSQNNIENEIHPSICTLHSLKYLDLSDNRLSGTIPACLAMSASSLNVLKLEKNNLHGTIPQSIGCLSHLQVLDLSNNQLRGVIPRSLVNCTELEVLNLGYNMLADFFPFWLGNRPQYLKVLILRENKFHGKMEDYFGYAAFLHIVDVSGNDLTGTLPSNFFLDLMSMMYGNEGYQRSLYTDTTNDGGYFYSVSITSKGQLLEYPKVSVQLKVIDFSHNKFKGKIPPVVGNLKGIQVLNFSGNMLNEPIPSSLGNLTNLESLDLSGNKLSGKIPSELVSLGFLEVFNVSHNNLTGEIPQGGQLNTFSSLSYEGNPGLCGPPSQKSCSNHTVKTPTRVPTPKTSQNFKFELDGFGWEEVLIGYVCGLVIGLVIGCVFVQEEWLKRFFHVKMHRYGRQRS